MGKKKGKSGGQAGQGQQAPGTSQPSQPSTSAATPTRTQEQSVPQPQQQPQQHKPQQPQQPQPQQHPQPQQQLQQQQVGGGGDGQQSGGGGAWRGRGGRGASQQQPQQGYAGQEGGQQHGGRGSQGGYQGRGGQGSYQGRGGQQQGGGGDREYQGERHPQQQFSGRGSPSPSQSSGGGEQYGSGRGGPGPMEQGQARGGRGGGRGDGRGGGRGDGRGRGRGQPPQQYPTFPTQADAPPTFDTQQFPGFRQPTVQPQPQRSAQPMPQILQKVAQLQVQDPPPLQQQQQQPMERPHQAASAAPVAAKATAPVAARATAPVAAKATAPVAEEVPTNFRKGGTQGRKIQVLANHFQIKLSPKTTIAYQYDVALDPDKPKKLLQLVMQQVRQKYYPNNHPAFDGMKNLFSPVKLPLQMPFSGEIKIMEDEREKEYKVKIQFARDVDLAALAKFFGQRGENHMLPPMHALQCMDVVLRSRPSTTMIIAGRSFFSVPDRIVTLGNGMEMYRGFYQSAILGWKPFLNIDVSHKAFPTRMPILDLLREMDDRVDLKRDLMRNLEERLGKFLYNLKVEYKIPNLPASKRNYRVNGLDKSANRFTFKNDDGKEMTVAAYFQDVKRYKLQYPHLPCLWVGSKQRTARMVLPCELCVVLEGQVTNRKMDDIQTRNMIKEAATSTSVRKDHIMRSMRVANHNESPSMKEFGLSIDPNMTEVTARVLQPPTIKYQNQQRTQIVAKGVWRGGTFWKPSEILKWAIVCMDDKIYDKQLSEMRDLFVRQGANCGMRISNDARITKLPIMRNGQKEIYGYFATCKKEQLQLIVVVLLDYNKSCYSWVKKTAELQTGCLTQCIKSNTMRRMNTQTVDNILLKINAKLNGVNHVLGDKPLLLRRPVMIMGADVTHPSPEARENTPSVAAVTASHDPQAFYYNIEWRLQDARAEIITDLENITREQLRFFREKTNCRPERIIFYRDGVSDGQFEAVRRMEIQAIRNACKSLEADYQPAVTFLVVQKRHHTRLFPCDPRDSDDRNVNVPAGTCVDTQITHPTAQDFYLVSHASIQGVAKPTKYRTIWDDSDFTDDDIEQLTYHLCHMFARCNRSVSYPAPTYYAHLAAARAKVYIEDQSVDMRTLKTMHERMPITEIIQKGHPMFFV